MDDGNYILEINNLSVQVGGKTLLDHLDLKIPRGEIHALLGQNGSGKSTLLMTIMGFSEYKTINGTIMYNGQDITEMAINDRAKLGIGIAMQRPPTINGVTLKEVLDYLVRNDSKKDVLISELELFTHCESFMKRSINKGFSGGEIKRSELIQLLALKPEFALIDEPDSGVDIESIALIGALIKRIYEQDDHRPVLRKSGLIITHNCGVFDYFHVDKIHVMHNGQIICSGNPELIIDSIRENGYEGCLRCNQKRMYL
jgi:Fe-S cluster assembly ATP-binding protein